MEQRTDRARLHRRLAGVQALFARRRAPRHGVSLDYPPRQSPAEERVNGLLHAAAALASVVGAMWLIPAAVGQGDLLTILGCTAYSASLTAVLATSALSHLVPQPRWQHLFRTLDQASIYLLTAGSCTPYFIRFVLPSGWDWLLPLLWGIALLGAWDKLRGDRVDSVSILSNVALGWFPIIAAKPLLTAMPTGCLLLVIASGGCYMLGVVFLMQDERRRYFHAVWHILVIAASACTYAGIAIYIV